MLLLNGEGHAGKLESEGTCVVDRHLAYDVEAVADPESVRFWVSGRRAGHGPLILRRAKQLTKGLSSSWTRPKEDYGEAGEARKWLFLEEEHEGEGDRYSI